MRVRFLFRNQSAFLSKFLKANPIMPQPKQRTFLKRNRDRLDRPAPAARPFLLASVEGLDTRNATHQITRDGTH
jgi:hypothetical protein